MTPEQLAAHRDNFERKCVQYFGLTQTEVLNEREGAKYLLAPLEDAWQAYQWALADVAASCTVSVQLDAKHLSVLQELAEKHELSPERLMIQALRTYQLVDSGKFKPVYENMLAEGVAAQQSAQPAEEPPTPWEKALEIRMAQGWKLKGNVCPVLYTDTINGDSVGRDDLWLATAEALKSAQPVEVQHAHLTDAEICEIGKAAYAVEGSHILPVTFARAIEAAHGIKPTGTEGHQ